ncbi:MAG: HD domain-containing phosphohydrolase [Alphaproteobacteria bacterium]|nr:HD domain-containing phosphohydrolase [Alphaproteobacteria bacterium]
MALLLLYALVGGASFSIAKFALGHGAPASGYAFWQAAGSGLVILAVCLLRRARFWLSFQAMGFYLMTGLVCLALPNVVMFLVLRQIPAGIMAVTVALMPLLTYGLTLSVGIESFDRRRVGGIVAGLAGVFLILLPRAGLPAPEMVPWVVLAILTPALFSLGNVFVSKRRPPEADVLGLTFGMLLMAAAGLLVFTLATGEFYSPSALGPIEVAILLQVAVSSTVEAVDRHLSGHSLKLELLCVRLAERLGCSEPEIATLEIAANLSQIGKLSVPSQILTKAERLSDEEQAIMRRHIEHTDNILSELDFGLPVRDVVVQMHERLDGSGYPRGLSDDQITLLGRILGIADVFVARTTPRSYRDAISEAEAAALLEANPERYDAHIVEILMSLVGDDEGEVSAEA